MSTGLIEPWLSEGGALAFCYIFISFPVNNKFIMTLKCNFFIEEYKNACWTDKVLLNFFLAELAFSSQVTRPVRKPGTDPATARLFEGRQRSFNVFL